MDQSVTQPDPSTIYGTFAAPGPTPEQAANPLACLDGCIADHLDAARRGVKAKECHAVGQVATVSSSYDGEPLLISAHAWTEGSVRSAEIGVLREGDPEDRALFFDPAEVRKLAAILLQAADEAENLARTARQVAA